MSSKDIMMEPISDLMWTEEEEVDPNHVVPILGVNCTGGGGTPAYPTFPLLGPAEGCRPSI